MSYCWAANLAALCAHPEGATSDAAGEARKELEALPIPGFDTSEYVRSLAEDGMRWRQQLRDVADQCDGPALRVALADDCIANPLIDEEDLGCGVFGRRYNSALDLARVPFTVGDVQDLFAMTATGLAEGKITWGHQGMMFAGNFALGAAGGWFGLPGAGAAGRRGTEFFMDRIAEVDTTALSTAQLLTAAQVMLADTDDCDDGFLAATWTALVDELIALYSAAGPKRGAGQPVGELNRDMRIVEAAEKEVRALVDERHLRGSRRPLPDVARWNALAAGHLLELLGYSVAAEDATGSRGVWNKDGWQVVSQSSPAGSTAYEVRLHCRKWSD